MAASGFRSTMVKYVHTEEGRRVIMYGSAAFAAAISWGYVGYQTFFIESYRDTLQLYTNGLPARVSPKTVEQATEIFNEMELSTRTRGFVRFFTVFGFDPYHIGSTKTNHGAYIGVPASFDYKSPKDINRADMRVGTNIPVSWNTDEGRLLEQSLILSDNAKKFALAREISMAHTHHVYAYSGIHSLSFMLYYVLSATANDSFYGLHKPASFRFTVYSLIAAFTYGVWSVSKDILTKFYEKSADKNAASLGISYAKGGVEFYSKIIQRNMAIRALMGKEGESLYTQLGNDVEFIRQKHVPFSERKLNAEDAVKEYYKKLESSKSSKSADDSQRQAA